VPGELRALPSASAASWSGRSGAPSGRGRGGARLLRPNPAAGRSRGRAEPGRPREGAGTPVVVSRRGSAPASSGGSTTSTRRLALAVLDANGTCVSRRSPALEHVHDEIPPGDFTVRWCASPYRRVRRRRAEPRDVPGVGARRERCGPRSAAARTGATVVGCAATVRAVTPAASGSRGGSGTGVPVPPAGLRRRG